MGWSHPDISLEDLICRIKGFVDILVLASGYQSSGLPAIWDADNIKKAVSWGDFFEDVLRRLHDHVDYEDSVKELDASLFNLTSNSYFPQGLAHMSSTILYRARDLVLAHLLQTHPLRDTHLINLFTTAIEMDTHHLTEMDSYSPNTCLDKFMVQMESLNLVPEGKGFIKESSTSSPTIGYGISFGSKYRVCGPRSLNRSYVESNEHIFVGCSSFIVQELCQRQATMSCLSSLETCLGTLSKVFTRNNTVGPSNVGSRAYQILHRHVGRSLSSTLGDNSQLRRSLNFTLDTYMQTQFTCYWNIEIVTELFLWNQWRSKCFSYLLNKRTISLLSGADLIFSTPKVQWVRVFEPLKVSIDAHNDNLLEIMEISLLGFISSRWSFLIDCFTSHSSSFLSIHKQYSDLQLFLQGNSQPSHSEKQTMNSKEKYILEYITPLLVSQPRMLWLLPAVLVAVIPAWSILFRIYLSEIERQFNGAPSPIRCCDCNKDGKEHRDCEVAERIRCLHVFHVQGSFLMVG